MNQTRYNDFVPMVYGTAWYQPPVVFARNDGNLTRMEVLLGIGEMQGVLKVLVNDVEIPVGCRGQEHDGDRMVQRDQPRAVERAYRTAISRMAADIRREIRTGAWRTSRWSVPNRLNDGSSLPRVKVLAQGLRAAVVWTGRRRRRASRSASNPAWILLDVLRRMGWSAAEIDLASFAQPQRRIAMSRSRLWT